MTRPVPLIRRFTEIPEIYQDREARLEQLWPHLPRSERLDWAQLDDLYRIVILADPGAGKTFELRAKAEQMAEGGRAAFFIRIEDIDETFGGAFEVGDAAEFERWLAGVDEGWFYLDSVDEVRLESQRAFDRAIRAFASRIHTAAHRAHVVISSRPYAWDFSLDSVLMQEVLPHEFPIALDLTGDEPEGKIGPASDEAGPRASPLKIFRLAELDNDDIRIFGGARGVADVNALLDALERAALMDLARVPFDLEDLIATWQDTKSLDGRLHVLERGLERRLSPPTTKGVLPLEAAMAAARRLALAATLAGEANLRFPGGEGGGLDTSALLPDWTPDDIDVLLRRGVFSDPSYGAVRFRHRETRELLAAQQLAAMLKSPERRAEVEGIVLRTIYGVTVIPPRLRAVMPWLILYDESIQAKALAIAPELATEGGDAAGLPLEVRRGVLRDIVRAIVEDRERGGDNSQLARIAHEDLSEETLAQIAEHSGDDGAVFFLGRLAWQGKMTAAAEALAPIARDQSRGDSARIVSVRAVATVLGAEAGHALWAERLSSGEILPRQLLAEFVDGAPANGASVRLLLASLDQLQPYARFTTSGLSWALHGFIGRLPRFSDRAPENPLVMLAEGLAAFLAREPYIERRECRVSEAYQWLMAPALDAIARLVVNRSSACLGPIILRVVGQIPASRDYGDSDSGDQQAKLGALIPRWAELNDALFWHTVNQVRTSGPPPGKVVTDDWEVEWMRHLWAFDAATFERSLAWISTREFADDKLVALTRSYRTYAAHGRRQSWRRALWRAAAGDPVLEACLGGLMRPAPSPERKRWRARDRRWRLRSGRAEAARDTNRARWVARTKAEPELVRAPKLAPGVMSRDQAFVMDSLPGDSSYLARGAAGSWRKLVPEFGEAVAEAFADGARRHWRAYRPDLRSEGCCDNTIPYALRFAMVGLEIEAGVDGTGLAGLSEDEARRAMRYTPRELNGFPSWFERLYKAHPAVGLELVWKEAQWELSRPPSAQPLHYILNNLAYGAPWLHADLAPLVLDWLSAHGAATGEALNNARRIMLSGGAAPAAIAALARDRIADIATPAGQLPVWCALWVDSDPGAAIPTLAARLGAMPRPEDAAFAEQFVVSLVGGRHGGGGSGFGAWREPAHLKALYLLMHQYIRVAEDINRANTGVFSPGLRDDAQDARDALFSHLAKIPGQATYNEILRLAAEHPAVDNRAWMRRRAHERAVEDGDHTFAFDEIVALVG